MVGTLQPLDQKFAIVDTQGRPTDYFTRWAQQRQIDIGDGITLVQMQEYLTAHALLIEDGDGAWVGYKIAGDAQALGGGLAFHNPLTGAYSGIFVDFNTGSIYCQNADGTEWFNIGGDVDGNGRFEVIGSHPWEFIGHDLWANGVKLSGGGATGTPTVRNSTIQSSSASSYVVPWPAGTVAGDVVIIFMEHGFSPNVPVGWLTINRNTTGTAQGMTIAKVMTAADITAGSVTVTASGAFNGSIAAITIDGTTMGSINQNVANVGSGLNVSAGVAASPTNLILGFGGWRANSVVSFDANWTNLQAISAASASATLAKYTGAPSPLGGQAAIASTVSGTFYYSLLSLIGV